jgi:uncharacterized protein
MIQDAAGRIEIIDAIRGMAIFGILVANIRSWSGYRFMSLEEVMRLPLHEFDAFFNCAHYWLVDGKFYAVFSMLFGVGFGIQYLKNIQSESAFISRYRRRIWWLLLFGAMHAFLWSGDILTLYALLAFVLIQMRNINERWILPIAILLLLAFSIVQFAVLYGSEPATALPMLALKTYPDMTPGEIALGFGSGNLQQVFMTNLHNLSWRWSDFLPNGRITRVLGYFLLGFYLAKSGYFSLGVYSTRNLLIFAVTGLIATAIAWLTGTNLSLWSVSGVDVILKLVLVLGQVCMAFTYMGLIAKISEYGLGARVAVFFAYVGRMAFTSYIMQTVVGIGLFYGIGFGLWGTMGLAYLWPLAIAIFMLQVFFCRTWLCYFRQGPLEWLWACLTSGELRKNRRG